MAKPVWAGRFKKEMHPLLKEFSYSLKTDGELLDAEIRVDIAWARMLARIKLISSAEAHRLEKGLKAVLKDLSGGKIPAFEGQVEDIHSLIQNRLEKKIGPLGKKIHTARSRNDLVVTSTRVYMRDQVDAVQKEIRGLQSALVCKAEKLGDMLIAGMTHLRQAQPVLLAHQFLAYTEMLEDDYGRFQDLLKRMDVLPLGSAALAGSALPLDQTFLARELGFSRVVTNSMAMVSDRGFLTEFLSAAAMLWVHLSRLSEDFILWNSEAFGYVELDDAFATGSSLMPQKKNPDVFELVRGRCGVMIGHLTALLTVQKGLPLTYNRDLQEDKPGVFDAARKTRQALQLLALTIESAVFRREAAEAGLNQDALFATDLLEYLVRKNVAFSDAHAIMGKIVRASSDSGKAIREFSLSELRKFHKAFAMDVFDLLDPRFSVENKKTRGSTRPAYVRQELARWKKMLKIRG